MLTENRRCPCNSYVGCRCERICDAWSAEKMLASINLVIKETIFLLLLLSKNPHWHQLAISLKVFSIFLHRRHHCSQSRPCEVFLHHELLSSCCPVEIPWCLVECSVMPHDSWVSNSSLSECRRNIYINTKNRYYEQSPLLLTQWHELFVVSCASFMLSS